LVAESCDIAEEILSRYGILRYGVLLSLYAIVWIDGNQQLKVPVLGFKFTFPQFTGFLNDRFCFLSY